MEVNLNKYNPFKASSYIKLPEEIALKTAVVNIRNTDEYCFPWSIVAALNKPSVPVDKVTSYPHFNTILSVSGIDFPIALKDISKFELLNDISINVYTIEKF